MHYIEHLDSAVSVEVAISVLRVCLVPMRVPLDGCMGLYNRRNSSSPQVGNSRYVDEGEALTYTIFEGYVHHICVRRCDASCLMEVNIWVVGARVTREMTRLERFGFTRLPLLRWPVFTTAILVAQRRDNVALFCLISSGYSYSISWKMEPSSRSQPQVDVERESRELLCANLAFELSQPTQHV